MDRAVFPEGTKGQVLDAFARAPIWQLGLDFRHGTGHGIGAFLSVHEGPHGLSYGSRGTSTALGAGFLTSNEPGYYEVGEFGIRIENVCIVQDAPEISVVNGNRTEEGVMFRKMEVISFAPIQAKMIDLSMMSEEEIRWVDDYHVQCVEKLSPLLERAGDNFTLAWLMKNTRPLKTQLMNL